MKERSIAIFGSTSVGKSKLIIRFTTKQYDEEYIPTINQEYRYEWSANRNDYELVIYDTAGLEEQSEILSKYLRSNGFILAYSIADRQSFKIVQDIYYKLSEELGMNTPIILVGNKSDLSDQRVISYEEGQKLAKSFNASFMEASSKEGHNVEEVFLSLLKKIDSNSFNSPNQANNPDDNQANNIANNNVNNSNTNNARTNSNKKQSGCIVC